MNQAPRHRSKFSRFLRHNRELLFVSVVVVVILAAVALGFWVITSSRFVKGQ